MITLQETVEISCPVADVFNYVANLENVQKWQPAVVEVKRLTDGPVRVGSRFAEVARMLGRRIETVCEITSLEPNRTLAFKATSSGPLEYETTYTFEHAGGSTRLTILGTFRTRGIWRLLEPLLRGEVLRESRQELAAMKRAIEAR